jgi:peptide/nickel transport system ATP-binding protein
VENILEVKGLKTQFFTEGGVVRAVDGVDIYVKRGEVLGIVGESGCGKSVTSLSIMRLIGQPGKITEGEIIFDNVDLVRLPESKMVDIRGNRISMIFQPTAAKLPQPGLSCRRTIIRSAVHPSGPGQGRR